jgi:hypothetical protein
MKIRIAAFTALFFCVIAAWLYYVAPSEKAARAKVNQGVFDAIKKDSKWNMESPMLYGYFFIGEREWPLKVLGYILRIGGHRFVGIRKDDDLKKYWLHVEEVRVHNLDSISVKDVRLRQIGKIVFLSEYDGWDVGPDLSLAKPKR